MKVYLIIISCLIAQNFASDHREIQVRGIGGIEHTIQIREDSTEGEVFEKVCTSTGVLPELAKVLIETRSLVLDSRNPFPAEVNSVTLVKIIPNCRVEIDNLSKRVMITSGRFPNVKIYHPDNLGFNGKTTESLLKTMIPRLFSTEGETRTKILTFAFQFSASIQFLLRVPYKSDQDNWFYFSLILIKWVEENMAHFEFGEFHSDSYQGVHGKLDRMLRSLFLALRSNRSPLFRYLRDEIQARTIEEFEESPRELTLSNTVIGDQEINNILEYFGLEALRIE